jgi:YcaO-like protein with predicted kinase domain
MSAAVRTRRNACTGPTTWVYAGLSADREEVLSVLPEARFEGPVQRGDLAAALRRGAQRILILDGRFHQSLAVSPSEIMDALRRGVRVYGASSMGALRAAELEPYGMVGSGSIFRYIRERSPFRDDFIAQLFSATRKEVQERSITFVELHLNLRALSERGLLRDSDRRTLEALYRDLDYADRDLDALRARLDGHPRARAMSEAAELALEGMERPKRADAREALEGLRRDATEVRRVNAALRHPIRQHARTLRARPAGAPTETAVSWELGAAHPPEDLLPALDRCEPIRHRENGNRHVSPDVLIHRLEAIMPLVGNTRIAELTHLAEHGFPVFQSTRPDPWTHTEAGTTTGAQGKGLTEMQARISCLVETVEGYCLEPRVPRMLRASYDFLSRQHRVADPRQFVRATGAHPPRLGEPLMWTEALCLEGRCSVWVPAELVFFNFFARDYGTRSVFPCSTHGAGGGSTPLEAVTHALYECIEGHYEACVERGDATLRRLDFGREAVRALVDREGLQIDGGAWTVRIYAALLPRIRNLPFFLCFVDSEDAEYFGTGCCANVEVALHRAVSEAFQAMTATYSGSREDLADHPDEAWQVEEGRVQGISFGGYRRRIVHRSFRRLDSELRFLKRWLHEAGFPLTYVANLTRRGIDLPIVKALVPGMGMEAGLRNPSEFRRTDLLRVAYGGGSAPRKR